MGGGQGGGWRRRGRLEGEGLDMGGVGMGGRVRVRESGCVGGGELSLALGMSTRSRWSSTTFSACSAIVAGRRMIGSVALASCCQSVCQTWLGSGQLWRIFCSAHSGLDFDQDSHSSEPRPILSRNGGCSTQLGGDLGSAGCCHLWLSLAECGPN